MVEWRTPFEKMEVGKAEVVREGEDVVVLSIGHIGNYVTKAASILKEDNIDIGHVDMRFVKPIDTNMIDEVVKKYKNIITLEDGSLMGGFGSAVLEYMADKGYTNRVTRMGIPDEVIEQGEQLELHRYCGYDPEGIARTVKKLSTQVLENK